MSCCPLPLYYWWLQSTPALDASRAQIEVANAWATRRVVMEAISNTDCVGQTAMRIAAFQVNVGY